MSRQGGPGGLGRQFSGFEPGIGPKSLAQSVAGFQDQIDALNKGIASGDFLRFVQGSIAREGAMNYALQQARVIELNARYGVLGGTLVRWGEGLQASAKSLQQWSSLTERVFNQAAGAIMGFVRSGLHGTAQGELLAYQFQLLSREIASIFLPTIQDFIGALQSTIDWFRALDSAQQKNIERWVTVGAVVGIATVALRAFILTLLVNPLNLAFLALAVAIGFAIKALLDLEDQGKKAMKDRERYAQGEFQKTELANSEAAKFISGGKDQKEKIERADAEIAKWRRKIAELEEENKPPQKTGFGPWDWMREKGFMFGRGMDVLMNGSTDPKTDELMKAKMEHQIALRMRHAGGAELAGVEDPKKRHNELTLSGGHFEGVGETYRRIAQAASRTSVMEQLGRQQLDEQKGARSDLQRIIGILGGANLGLGP